MKRRKLILVNPTLTNPFPGFPPLGLGYVAALTPKDWDIEILDENFEEAVYKECDLVGITGFTAMANRAYQVALIFRKHGVPVVMGGIHASMMPDEALRYADAVVVGEAESVWPQVIADFEACRLREKYQGELLDLKGQVIPRRDLFNKYYVCDTIQTTRGCPHNCEFCSVSQFNGFAYRQRPVDEVLDEMAILKRKYLFIVDDNIVGQGKKRQEYAVALAKGMVERGFKFAWYSHAALNVADNEEVLEAFHQAGCRLLFLGIESEDREVLQAMNKNVNLRKNYQQVIDRIHKHHIGVHGSFIFGNDEDTIEKLAKRFDYILNSNIDVIQYCALTPYPGTRLFNKLKDEGRLIHTDFPADWNRYDLTEVLFKPHQLQLEAYQDMMLRIGATVYKRRNVAKRFVRSLWETKNLNTAIWCFFTNKIYRTPRTNLGKNAEKFWYLSQETWPLIKLYQRVDNYFS